MSEYPVGKGYVSALVVHENAPDNKAAMWAVGPDMNNVSDFRFYVAGSWQSIYVLFNIAHVGPAAPADLTKLWYDTSVVPDPVYKIYDAVSTVWIQLDQLYPIHVGAAAPGDTRKIWQKPLGSTFELFKYNSVTTTWDNMLKVPSVEISGTVTINDKTYDQKILWSQQAGLVTVKIDPGVPVDFSVVVERNANGRLMITATGGVKINGVADATVEIEFPFSSVWIRAYAANSFKIEGQII